MGRTALLLLSVLFCLDGARANEKQFFGTLRGVLRHNALQRDQPAKLDFILDRKSAGNVLELAAVLTLRLGGKASSEYVSYSYETVRYNPFTSSLIFEQGETPLTIFVARYDGKHLEAAVRGPLLAPQEATLILDRAGVPSTLPPIQELAGFYRGEKGVLDLQTFRSTEERLERENPFAEYEIRGRLARVNPDLGGLVIDNTFTAGSYDFFKGRLILTGTLEPLVCKVDIDLLDCDGEKFLRESVSALPPVIARPAPWTDAAEEALVGQPTSGGTGAFSGRYWGWLYHEARDQYQLADLNLAAYPGPAGGSLLISSAASLHFGDPARQEALCYKFEQREYNFASQVVVFRRSGTDAIVQITSIDGKKLRGVWYSRLFGRVGTFELHRDAPPPPPAGAKIMQSLTGTRDGDIWRLQLRVAPKPAVTKSSNPFAPLSFAGLFWDRHQIVLSKSSIFGGSYDFYTGRISLPVTAAGESVSLTGEHGTDNTLGFSFHLSNRFGSSFRPQQVLFPEPAPSGGNQR